jgi:hypothetical protein
LLIKAKKAMSVLLVVLFIITQCCIAMAADDVSETISQVAIGIGEDTVLFDIGQYGIAMAAGEGDKLYDYMAGDDSPNVRAVVSRSGKYIAIGDYGDAFAEYGTVQDAVTQAEELDDDIIKSYKLFIGFDEGGEPILTDLFAPSYSLTLEANPSDGGSVTDNTGSASYKEGAKVSVTAEANTGYKFVNWTVGEEVVSTDSTFEYEMPAEDVTLVANFVRTLFDVTFTVKDSDGNDINNATISLGDQKNQPGDYVFENISAGEYSYTVTAEGYETVTGEVVVTDEDVTVNVVMEAAAVTVEHVYRDGVSVDIDGVTYYGIRELVYGVYNVELDISKIEERLGSIENCIIHIEIDGKTVLGEDDNKNIISTFLIRDGYVLLPAIQHGNQVEEITINPENLARAVVVLTKVEFEPVPVSELSRDSTSVGYEGEFYYGIREVLTSTVYNVELDMDKVEAKFGYISGYKLQLRIDGELVNGEDDMDNKVNYFIIREIQGERYAVLPAIQQGIQDAEITINPKTLGEAMVFLVKE